VDLISGGLIVLSVYPVCNTDHCNSWAQPYAEPKGFNWSKASEP